ncbi:MAG: heterodisulfide reductase-related iron-sulfur binding cluster [Candidatus Hodarchaeota archaeon]
MNEEKEFQYFRKSLCDLCGSCLHLCPVLQLPIEEAKKEIKNLMDWKPSKYALSKCNTCFSCNLYCPQNANPYQLILERWNDIYKTRGAPPLYRFICPTEECNIWQLLNVFLSSKEKMWINNWMHVSTEFNKPILLIGSYTHLFPFIIGGSQLLNYFQPMNLIDQWEAGAYLYQGGYLEIVKKIAKETQKDFDSLNVKNIAILTDSVEYLINQIHPNEMGIVHSQNFINLNRWILNKINHKEIKINKALNLSVTVHDNCYSKALNRVYWETPRDILLKCGCRIKEMKHIKENSLCCGFGAGASWVKNISIPFDIISEGIKKFKEAEETRAKALVSYCSGCIYLLWATKELIRSKMEIYHIIEVVRMAMGEKLNYPEDHINRAWDVIAIITYSLFLSLFQKKFYIKQIKFDKDYSTFKPKKFRLLKLIRRIFDLPLSRFIYSKLFQLMMPLMKTK